MQRPRMIRLPRVRELTPGLFLLEAELDDFDVRSVVIVGTDRAVVWDDVELVAPTRSRPRCRW